MRTGHRSRPVFLDQSGRRGRLMVLVGSAVGAVLVAILGLLVAGISSAVGVGVPTFPDSGRQVGAGMSPSPPVRTTTAPAAAIEPPAATTVATTAAEPSSSHRRVPTHTPTNQPRPSKPQ